jgi:selenocysteine lyase/cysteine desulfurase
MKLLTRLRDGLSTLDRVHTYCAADLSNHVAVLAVNMEDVNPWDAGAILDADFNIAVRVGYHCAPLVHQDLGTINRGAIRFSLGIFNTQEDIDNAVRAIESLSRSVG